MHPQILRMARWESQLGLLRYLPSRLYMPNENLSSSDRRLYQRIAYRQILSQAMLMRVYLLREMLKRLILR